MQKLYNESCYLGLIFESQVGDYEFDVYAYISHTRYKYLLIKNEKHSILREIGQKGGTLAQQTPFAAGQQLNPDRSNTI